jgi:hypothetical protein
VYGGQQSYQEAFSQTIFNDYIKLDSDEIVKQNHQPSKVYPEFRRLKASNKASNIALRLED